MAQLKLAATDASTFGARGFTWEILGVEARRWQSHRTPRVLVVHVGKMERSKIEAATVTLQKLSGRGLVWVFLFLLFRAEVLGVREAQVDEEGEKQEDGEGDYAAFGAGAAAG